jgi:hypothetical protein
MVVKGFGIESMMFLTSCPLGKQRKEGIWRIVEYYWARRIKTQEIHSIRFLEFPEFLDVFFSNSLEPLTKPEIRISGSAFFSENEDS